MKTQTPQWKGMFWETKILYSYVFSFPQMMLSKCCWDKSTKYTFMQYQKTWYIMQKCSELSAFIVKSTQVNLPDLSWTPCLPSYWDQLLPIFLFGWCSACITHLSKSLFTSSDMNCLKWINSPHFQEILHILASTPTIIKSLNNSVITSIADKVVTLDTKEK